MDEHDESASAYRARKEKQLRPVCPDCGLPEGPQFLEGWEVTIPKGWPSIPEDTRDLLEWIRDRPTFFTPSGVPCSLYEYSFHKFLAGRGTVTPVRYRGAWYLVSTIYTGLDQTPSTWPGGLEIPFVHETRVFLLGNRKIGRVQHHQKHLGLFMDEPIRRGRTGKPVKTLRFLYDLHREVHTDRDHARRSHYEIVRQLKTGEIHRDIRESQQGYGLLCEMLGAVESSA